MEPTTQQPQEQQQQQQFYPEQQAGQHHQQQQPAVQTQMAAGQFAMPRLGLLNTFLNENLLIESFSTSTAFPYQSVPPLWNIPTMQQQQQQFPLLGANIPHHADPNQQLQALYSVHPIPQHTICIINYSLSNSFNNK